MFGGKIVRYKTSFCHNLTGSKKAVYKFYCGFLQKKPHLLHPETWENCTNTNSITKFSNLIEKGLTDFI